MTPSIIKHSFLQSFSRILLTAILLMALANTSEAIITTYRVGTTGSTHTTIAAAYASAAAGTPGDTYYIDILSDYVSEATTGSIVLGANNGTIIIIRPFSGNNNFVLSTNISAPLFTINGATNVTIDGRPGSSGTTGLMTLQNTSTNGMVVQYLAASANNILQYCVIKGSNTNTASTAAGVISFKAVGANANTIDRCTIQAAGTNKPAVAVVSRPTDLGNGDNNTITISNCNIVDFTSKGIWVANPSPVGWRILNNHFYQTTALTATTALDMISIGGGSGYVISGNYFGGTAPNCGGNAYAFTSTFNTTLRAVHFSGSSGSSTLTGNTIANIAFNGSISTNFYGFTGMALKGTANFTLGGGAGLGNTIKDITYSNTATGGTAGFCAIHDSTAATSGSNIMSFNTITGIQITTLTNHASDIIRLSYGIKDATTRTIINNTIGSITAPVTMTAGSNGPLTIINGNGYASVLTVAKNTIQGISITNSTGTSALKVIYSANNANLDVSENTITNIGSAANGAVTIVTYTGSPSTYSGLMNNNVIHTISLSNNGNAAALTVFYIYNQAPASINGNIIGNTTANNISVSANALSQMIANSGLSALTATNNTIQNVTLSSNGTAVGFIGIGVQTNSNPFKCTDNTITNINNATANTAVYGCIHSGISRTGLEISGNTISRIAYTGTIGATVNSAIYLGGASGYGGIVSKNNISGLSNVSAATTARIAGIELAAGDWTLQNNIILLDNASGNTAVRISGINVSSSGGSSSIYHNTVKLSGTQTGTAVSSAFSATGTAGNVVVYNNIFQNLRTGGGSQYAENYTGGPAIFTDNNYLQSAILGRMAGTDYTTIASWKAAPVNAAFSVTGTATIDATGKVTSVPFAGASKGKNLGGTPPLVPDDFFGTARKLNNPWMGAYEGSEISNLKLKFPFTSITKTYGDAPFAVIPVTNNTDVPVTYSISPANAGSCISVTSLGGAITINCVPAGGLFYLVASQEESPGFKAGTDTLKVVVNKAFPVVNMITLPGILKDSTLPFRYDLPPGYVPGSNGAAVTLTETDPLAVATFASSSIKGDNEGTFEINMVLSPNNNFRGMDTTFTFTVYNNPIPPIAVTDTVVLIRNKGNIADGSLNLLLNDKGTTSYLRTNLTDIDMINPGFQNIFYSPAIGTFDFDPVTGVLTVRPSKGLTGLAKIGYTVTDSNGVTSDIAYVLIRIEDMEDLPDLKGNEVMTPNNDGVNDALFVGFTDISLNNSITIFDPAGNTVYHASNYRNDWLGTDTKGNPLEPGVYYFVFHEEEGLQRELKNFVTIVR